MSEELPPMVHTPVMPHSCGPNKYGTFGPDEGFNDPVGTVRQCGCGKSWVAYIDELDPGFMGVKWKREGWFAKRRRKATS